MLFRKDIDDVITKYLKEENIEYKYEKDIYSFNLNLSNYILNPYFTIIDNVLSFMINIKLLKKDNIDLNSFNTKSKFFTAKIKNNVLYLEYNAIVNKNNIVDVIELLISELNNLSEEIDRM